MEARTCFNTQPPEGGWQHLAALRDKFGVFQHTAARRRLGRQPGILRADVDVSTHSRPKAAGVGHPLVNRLIRFQHTAARRRLADAEDAVLEDLAFQHTAARRRLGI